MLKSLIGLRLASFGAALMGRGEKKPSKTVLFLLLYLYVGIVCVGMSVLHAIMLGTTLIPLGLAEVFLAVFLLGDFAVIFVLSTFETKSELFDCKDNALLLSMPIKPGSILLSRVFTVLIYNLAISVVILLPAAIVYLVLTGEVLGFIGTVAAMLIVPFPATALAAAFGYLIAYVSKRTRHSTLISVIITLLFVILYFYFYMQALSDESILENLGGVIAEIGGRIPFVLMLGRVATLAPLEFTLFVLVSALISGIAYLVLSHFYMRIITDSGVSKKVEYKAQRVERSSALSALIMKEFAKITSSSIYLLNAGLGTAMRVIIGVVAIIKLSELRGVANMLIYELFDASYDGFVALFVSSAMVILASLDMFSASSVSLEGKNLWIIRSMPVSSKTVLVSKSLAHAIITVPASVISSVLLLIAFGAGPLPYVTVIPTAMASCVVFALFGTVVNTALPKLDFENDAQPVKQSIATLVVMFGQMLWGVLMLAASYFGLRILDEFVLAGLLLLLNVLAALVLYLILIKVSARKFDNI